MLEPMKKFNDCNYQENVKNKRSQKACSIMCPILGKQKYWREGYNIMDAEVLIEEVVQRIG